ncbi:hypothetical protein NBRC111893_1086 [Lentilactobacillus kosonis]|uniref:Uncharacterized protein n=1 Tax=Lentilactobacillus kosonis TaxID=2810561 RepID=A0A401FKN1_9LACO|nr:hypothetical protein NBRC111893_1086 [Lentilactobacillus kosonis]
MNQLDHSVPKKSPTFNPNKKLASAKLKVNYYSTEIKKG